MAKHQFLDLIKSLKSRRMLVVLLLGFSSGLPIMLLYSTIKIWMRRSGVEVSTIGYISWMTVPYSFNFVWAFLLDRYTPLSFGRRKSWIFLLQISIIACLLLLSLGDPTQSISFIFIIGLLLCFFSATQDVVIDAYRREILPDEELGIGSSIGVYGYRVAMLVASGLGLWVVDPQTLNLTFNQMFILMAAFMGVGLIGTFVAREPVVDSPPLKTFTEAVTEPIKDFLTRDYAIWTLFFILMFKMGDSLAGSMLGPYYVDMGFTNQTIAEVTKGIGFISSMAGLFVGGVVIYRIGIYRAMWLFGILQGISTAIISCLSFSATVQTLTLVIAFEDFSSGMGTTAMVAFMAGLTNKRFTATQYALFASLASFGRTFLAGFSGVLIESTNYFAFFIICSLLAIPGLLLLIKMRDVSQQAVQT